MTGLDNFRRHHTYQQVLYKWRDKIQNLETICKQPKIDLTKQTRAQLYSKLENLKSYFYSARYYSANEEENSRKIIKNLLLEMKTLENEISSILGVTKSIK